MARDWLAPLAAAACLLVPLRAHAQAEQAASAPEPTPAVNAPAPAAPAAAAPAAPAAPGSIGCLIENNGLDPASAYTGGRLVCDEIRNQGVALAAPGLPTEALYRVSFDRLGQQVIARVAYEAPTGTALRTRRVVLDGPEEITVGAPRIAAAIVHDRPVSDSQKMDNLVGEETRQYKKKHGEFLWGLGIAGVSAPTAGVLASPGFEFMGYYETPSYGFGFSLRTSVGASGEDELTYASVGVGGRYFFGEGDVAPFVGAGLAVSGMEYRDAEKDEQAEGSGLGAFGEIGVEFMRLHSSRMILGLRADAPFYTAKRKYWDYSGDPATGERSGESSYHVPIQLSATYAW